mgnify:CR=1 FL=1
MKQLDLSISEYELQREQAKLRVLRETLQTDLGQIDTDIAIGAAKVEGDARICKVSIVGIGMKSHAGVAAKMFQVLSEEGINIQMISTSEIKTSVVIAEKYMELAVRALHKAFGLDAATV